MSRYPFVGLFWIINFWIFHCLLYEAVPYVFENIVKRFFITLKCKHFNASIFTVFKNNFTQYLLLRGVNMKVLKILVREFFCVKNGMIFSKLLFDVKINKNTSLFCFYSFRSDIKTLVSIVSLFLFFMYSPWFFYL